MIFVVADTAEAIPWEAAVAFSHMLLIRQSCGAQGVEFFMGSMGNQTTWILCFVYEHDIRANHSLSGY